MAAFQVPSSPQELSPWVNHHGSLPPEVDIEGNIEYKLKLIATAPDRLSEGQGSAIYEIGVADDGSFVGLSPEDMEVSLQTLHRMADFLKADVTILRKVSVESTRHIDEDGNSTVAQTDFQRRLQTNSGSPRTDPEFLVVEAKVTSRLAEEHHFLEIRVALVGGPDAGKSTLLGRLAHGIADNGRGKARLNLLRHRHEISSGRTSSISHEIMGFTATGETVNYNTTNISSWQEVCESSAKVVTLLDTCGHPRFLKTTISGLTGHSPDYACLIVDSRVGGVNEMTKEHLALAAALGLPTFVVVTKMDVATRDQLRATVTALMALIRTTGPSCLPTVNVEAGSSRPTSQSSTTAAEATSSPSLSSDSGTVIQDLPKFLPVIVHQEKDLAAVVKRFSDSKTIEETKTVAIPILLLSSVTGENVNLLEKFLFLLPKPSLDHQGGGSYSQDPACYQIEEIYNIPDIGTVVGGFLHSGRIEVHKHANIMDEHGSFTIASSSSSSSLTDTQNHANTDHNRNSNNSSSMRLYLGPVDRDGGFIPVVVKSIHRQRMSMRSIDSGQTATLAIEGPGLGLVKVRRGMVVLESDTDPKGTCCRKFEAVIQVLAYDGEFGVGFQGMIHCGSVHQNARVIKIELLPGLGQEVDSQENDDSTTVATVSGRNVEPDSRTDQQQSSSSHPQQQQQQSLRPSSRNSGRESSLSIRSSSPSSDYGSGTGSSAPGSVAISRSSSFRHGEGGGNGEGSAGGGVGGGLHSLTLASEDQPSVRLRKSRRRRVGESHAEGGRGGANGSTEGQLQGMIPISTMRTFRRMSIRRNSQPDLRHQVMDSNVRAYDRHVAESAAEINGQEHEVEKDVQEEEEEEEEESEPVELEAGSRARVVFRFCHDVAFMREGTTVLFRHGRTKCVGKVLRML
ncbi:GTP binding protein [Gryganskiella cystojenkinii]|nr:GTP binding protein [Gryganskiella cystojenkinii]